MNKNLYVRFVAFATIIVAIVIVIVTIKEPTGSNFSKIYSNRKEGFSIKIPENFKTDESYSYQALGPGKEIKGIKFGVPVLLSNGTNLSDDSYISVEEIPKTSECSASLFLSAGAKTNNMEDNNTPYSKGFLSDAAAGNRYDETVYAIPGTNPCLAIRYFIHYGAIENYPAGSIKQFDEQALINLFNGIRRTLVLNQ